MHDLKQDFRGSRSIWADSEEDSPYSAIPDDAMTDVCIVGAGIAGITTAYLLAREGLSVIVLNDGPIGGGETGRTTAHLSNAIDDRYVEIERIHGEARTRLVAASHTAAIDRIQAIAQQEKIVCDFERLDGYFFLAPSDSKDLLEREMEAAHRAGLTDVAFTAKTPLSGAETVPSIKFPRQGQFHPMKYLSGLAKSFTRLGGRIYTSTHVKGVAGGKPAQVQTTSGRIVKAESVVMATNTPVNDLVAIHLKQAAYRTYVVSFLVPKGSIQKSLFWDTQDPYHYIRVHPWNDRSDMLIVGGEDHKTGQADDIEDRYERLVLWARAHVPAVGRPECEWSGQIMESVDGLAYIGRNPMDDSNVYIATGDSGMGMTHGTIAGILLTDLIQGRPNPWADVYDPSRVRLGATQEFAQENANTAAQYTGWITSGDVESVEHIPINSGAVIREGMSKIAVYRDERSVCHACSAVCPHLGCIVSWNPSELSWDCPCHGSRFNKFGKVLNGPALSDLTPVELTKHATRT